VAKKEYAGPHVLVLQYPFVLQLYDFPHYVRLASIGGQSHAGSFQ